MQMEKTPGAAPPSRMGEELTQAGIRQVSRAITEEYIGRLKALAYEDAEAGDCRQGGHLDSLMKAQWENCDPACHAKAGTEPSVKRQETGTAAGYGGSLCAEAHRGV